MKLFEVTTKNGAIYFQSQCDGSWWRRSKKKGKSNIFIGSSYNLPECVKKAIKQNFAAVHHIFY